MAFYGKITKRDYSSAKERDHYETAARMRIDGERQNAEEAPLYEMPLEKFKELCLRADMGNQERQDQAACQIQMDTWLELHPEFVNTEDPNNANGRIMANWLRSRGVKWPTMQQLEDAYDSLRGDGLLHLRRDVMERQHQTVVRKRADEVEQRGGIRAPRYSEDELRAMPMDELRRLGA